MNLFSRVRNAEIVVQSLGQELLIYDLKTHQAYQLNETTLIVFEACGDRRSVDDLKRQYKFSENLICLTLDELKKNHLLAAGADYISPFAGMNRREVIRRAGLSCAAALPVDRIARCSDCCNGSIRRCSYLHDRRMYPIRAGLVPRLRRTN